jgi:hypothetical protein
MGGDLLRQLPSEKFRYCKSGVESILEGGEVKVGDV